MLASYVDPAIMLTHAQQLFSDASNAYWQAVRERERLIWEAHEYHGLSDYKVAIIIGVTSAGNVERARKRYAARIAAINVGADG